MVTAAIRRRLTAVRRSPRMPRVALVLWIAWAVIVWNVVFDHVLVNAGRWYLQAAYRAAELGGPYVHIEDWMRPAVARGLALATGAGGAILVVGLIAIRFGSSRSS
jgi:hypothetical protein